MTAAQTDLFGVPAQASLPDGWRHVEAFVDADEEAALLAHIAALPLEAARYKAWTAKRRVAHFGTGYDFDANRLLEAEPIPTWLHPLRERAARWSGLDPEAFATGLVAEYTPGTGLGWHRDVPDFEHVFGLSLGGRARLMLRPWPADAPKKSDVRSVWLERRSAYLLQGDVRWRWQHAIAPTQELRWSVTLRTLAAARRGGARSAALPR